MLNAIALLQHGRSTREVSKLLGISQSTRSRIYRECVPYAEPAKGGRSRSITLVQWQACVRTISIGGLDDVVDVRNALGEQLKVVASTNTLKRVFHEVRLGSLEKQKKPLLLANYRCCKLEFARRRQDWTTHDWYRVLICDETKINRFQFDGRAWCWVRDGESHYKLIMWAR